MMKEYHHTQCGFFEPFLVLLGQNSPNNFCNFNCRDDENKNKCQNLILSFKTAQRFCFQLNFLFSSLCESEIMTTEGRYLLDSMVSFVSSYSFLFNFSNVKVLSHINFGDNVPLEWLDFLKSSSILILKDILLGKKQSEFEFINEFVKKRNEIVTKFEDNCIIKCNIKCQNNFPTRGMNPKKIHEVKKFCDFLSTHLNLGDENKRTHASGTTEKRQGQHTDLIVDCGSGAGHLVSQLQETVF